MLHSSTVTSIILPMALVLSSFLLLGNIWTHKQYNKSLADDLGRGETELEMVLYQAEFCGRVAKEKEQEINDHLKRKEAIEIVLVKAKEDREKKLSNNEK